MNKRRHEILMKRSNLPLPRFETVIFYYRSLVLWTLGHRKNVNVFLIGK